MRITVLEPTGSVLTFNLEQGATLGSLRRSMNSSEGVPEYLQVFTENGTVLSDDDISLSEDMRLNVMYNLHGGGAKCETGPCNMRVELCCCYVGCQATINHCACCCLRGECAMM